MTLQEKQNKLNELYKPFFNNVKDKVGNEIGQYGNPLLIDLAKTNNINTDVMIFGKETDTWYNDIKDIDKLIEIYSKFLNDKLEARRLFWQCLRKWLGDENGVYVWNNLSKMDYNILKRYTFHFAIVVVVLLLIVKFTPLGVEINGARRWLNLGFFQFQPSEFSKLGIIMLLASWFSLDKKNFWAELPKYLLKDLELSRTRWKLHEEHHLHHKK